MMWAKFELQKITAVSSPKKRFNANTLKISIHPKEGHPYVVRTSLNNGIRGYIKEDEKYLNSGNTYSFGQDTATVFWQPNPYFTGDKIKVLTPTYELTDEMALFILIAIRKAFTLFSWGTDSFDEEIIKTMEISLPIKRSGSEAILDATCQYHEKGFIPDFEYMHKCIADEQKKQLINVGDYLSILKINNAQISKSDKRILEKKTIDKEFVMHDLFELLKAPYKGEGRKQDNVSKEKNEEYALPLINCKDGNNGVMYYGRRDDFTVHNNVLSIIYNGPPTEGQTYYQEEIGVFTDAYIIGLKDNDILLDRELGLYLTTAVNKSIHNLKKKKYSRGNKATWKNKVENDKIVLPIQVDKSGEPIIDSIKKYHPKGYVPDWDYMRNYIVAIEKTVVSDVVNFKDGMID